MKFRVSYIFNLVQVFQKIYRNFKVEINKENFEEILEFLFKYWDIWVEILHKILWIFTKTIREKFGEILNSNSRIKF